MLCLLRIRSMASRRCLGVPSAFGAAILLLTAASLRMATAADPATATKPAGSVTFWPPAPDNPRVQFLTAISSPSDVTGPATAPGIAPLVPAADPATKPAEFLSRPYGIRIAEGRLYACDAQAATVTVLDLRKHEIRLLGATGQVHLAKPIDIAISADGVKYIADTGAAAVMVFDADDKYAGKVAVKNMRPVSVGVFKDELFVSDLGASTVRVFNRFTGKELRTIGEPGGGKGQFGGCMGLALDKDGNISVNDVLGCKVQKFSLDGKFVSSLGGLGDKAGQFVRPKMMAADSAGILYVVDFAFNNVQMFNDKGELLMFFGGAGVGSGAMDAPTGICMSDDPKDMEPYARFAHPAFAVERLIFVSNNTGEAKINIYGLGQLKPGKTVRDIATQPAR